MTRKSRRLWLTLACLASLGVATALVLNAFSSNIVFFMAPSQVVAHPPSADRSVRLGGMVVAGSLTRETEGTTPVNIFSVTDGQAAVKVRFAGILPDLFREGQSVVALGTVQKDGIFQASEVLAKHDETYMPKEVAEALKRSGKWDPRFGKPPSADSWDTMTRADAKKVGNGS
ncbi:cytochrome c maturation protein CcmE [Kozakia baliensis]|uniref:Cytochrome c-type biogenesis protein CcmE n=1 Tax=Kozakia baliensis TaxID=153496 RepID=A0A1D8UWU6_9PROT|nr:cytochrome c maturation protein CcmE [Kozakia baliensis]AOX18076.1 cytochrome c biogenesis protein CcmE [Kozakia baliensis]AOX21110.1 cytochrome c biogenesis protein CcmE [Kozakia baliensis]